MRAFSWLKLEWKSMLKNPKILIPLLGILFVPILYSGTYLWAFWDPYAYTERLPVAVVNEDIPVKYEGKQISIGDDLIDELKREKSFDFEFVSKSEAESGIRNNHYFFGIFIPKDFSKRATTLAEENPKPLELYYQANVGSNYLASRIGDAGVNEIRNKVSEKISQNYAKIMFEDITSVGEGMHNASDAANKINSGLVEVRDGTNSIKAGMENKTNSIQALTDGAKQLSDSATTLAVGTKTLNGKMSELSKGMSALNNGIGELKTSGDKIGQTLDQLSSGSIQLNDVITNYAKANPSLQKDNNFGKILAISKDVSGGLQALNTSYVDFQSGMTDVSESSANLSAGAGAISTKMNDLVDGTYELASAQENLANGTNDLINGWVGVTDHLGTLLDGEKKLVDGSGQLSNHLRNGAEKIEDIHTGQPIYEMMSNPVRLKEELLHDVPNYGTGLAPYFLSISFFVGALLLSTVFPLRETSSRPPSAFSWFFSKFFILTCISILHSIITNFLLIHLVGLEPVNTFYLYFFSFFTSLVFMALIQFLVTMADNVGRFIGIILLVLQLTTSSGTFPIELIPTALRRLNALLPMTYTVDGFRTIISTGDYHLLGKDILALVPFIVLSIIVTLLIFKILIKKRPALESIT